MIKQFFIIACIACGTAAYAQNQEDVLRYSKTNVLGTARSQALGGAFGAVGADFSSTQINPAGLGLYRRNEVHLSTALTFESAETGYLNNTQSDLRLNFNVPSIGIVLTKVFNEMGNDVQDGLSSISFAAGINRVNNFQKNVTYNGTSTGSSVNDYFIQQANGRSYTNFESDQYSNDPAAQAWNTLLLDTISGSNGTDYRSWLTGVNNYKLRQNMQMTVTGAMLEYNLTAAANISNWFYFGGGLVITQVYRESKNIFTEEVLDNSVPELRSVTVTENVKTSGSGVSGRFGIIIRPIDLLRFGASIQTPTIMNLRDDYNNITAAAYATQAGQTRAGAKDFIEYQVITPAKYTVSGALITRYGLLSLDVDVIDYTTPYMKSDFAGQNISTNAAVKNLYQRAVNIRGGIEVKLADIYRVRAGAAQFGSPYNPSKTSISESDLTRYSVSGGLGVVMDGFFFDITAVNTFGKNYYAPYVLTAQPYETATSSFSNLNFVLSGGYRF